FTGPWVLVLFHLKGAMEEAGKNPDQETRLPSWSLFRLVGGISILLFFLTLFFFMTFPRLGVGFFGPSWASGSAVTGFSDRLALGEVAEIQKSAAVAMRVSMDQSEILRGRELHWRGVALDHFDGRRWQKSKTGLTRLRRLGETYLLGEEVSNRASLIRQRIILEPNGSPALFTLNKPVMISGRLRHLFRDPLGNLRAASPFHLPVSYETLSYLEASWQEEPPASNFLQLPTIDSRIIQLSRRITEGISEEINKARALERYLQENYRYTLKGLPIEGKNPLAAFLFEVRQGNCEYFSSALTVMLRTLGIPARVVNGYLGGEWNPYGKYYLIRQSNAHSWVETYIADRGG
ncbi:MAG: transglutaminaseTgpA domain-containing protein, partial [Candidatus Binatia bacterium]